LILHVHRGVRVAHLQHRLVAKRADKGGVENVQNNKGTQTAIETRESEDGGTHHRAAGGDDFIIVAGVAPEKPVVRGKWKGEVEGGELVV